MDIDQIVTQFNNGVDFVAEYAGNFTKFFEGVSEGSTASSAGSSNAADVTDNVGGILGNIIKIITAPIND